MTNCTTFHEQLAAPGMILAPGVYDGATAVMARRAGFETAFVSGACIAFARFGIPDLGLVSFKEVEDTITAIADVTDIQLIVDADTGFGNALNIQRTVRLLERAGAAAIQIEDQLLPKRCGHMAGKQVVAPSEMVGKIKAALDARVSDSTKIIARTDALGVNGFEDALARAEMYADAGADALFIEAPKSVEQMQNIGDKFGHLPLVNNMVEGGGSPIKDAAGLEAIGYKIALYPAALLNMFVPKAEALLSHIKAYGSTQALRSDMVDLNYLNEVFGAGDLLELSEKYKGD